MGSHLCDGLLNHGHKVRIFEKKGAGKKNIEHLFHKIDYREGDFTVFQGIREALSGMDVIFHLIGTTLPKSSNDDTIYDISSNLIPTLRMLETCGEMGIKKVIFASSGGTVYGIPRTLPISEDHPTQPICSYGIQKLAIENYLALYHRLYGVDYAILRISNPYGERQAPDANQGSIPVFIGKVVQNEMIEVWGDGSIVRDYIHVSDVVKAFLSVLDCSMQHRLFNIGTGIGHSLLDVISEIEKIMGRSIQVKFSPPRPVDVPINVLDIGRAKNVLGWSPTITFSQGIDQMLQSLKRL